MAGVDVGSEGSKKRATNSDINMIPFIDLLMCTIAFLLITAVWVTNSRIDANAQVPGADPCAGDCRSQTEKALHVYVGDDAFKLVWKQAATVLREISVPRAGVKVGQGSSEVTRYDALAKTIETEWTNEGAHRDPSDGKLDQAILHSDDKLSFKEIIATLDAVNAAKRNMKLRDGTVAHVPAFQMTFATR